jgi:glycosyltransferase involved in cell wall biosynthesis
MDKDNAVVVSVCMITYNHERFIARAIEGVLMQRTTFTTELVLSDDLSTDHTRSICSAYQQKYSGIIKLRLQEKNLGAIPNFVDTLKACTGKYIAFCEGDDYWIDPLKLQKQVDFLETHPGFALCFHNAMVLSENHNIAPYLFNNEFQKQVTTIKDVIKNWYISSASILFSREYLPELPDWVSTIHSGDYALLLLLAGRGKIGYIKEVMSVYFKHAGAMSFDPLITALYLNERHTQLYKIINQYFDYKYDEFIQKQLNKFKRQRLQLLLVKKIPVLKYLRVGKLKKAFFQLFRIGIYKIPA